MIDPERRENLLRWIDEAVRDGSRLQSARALCGMDTRPHHRWKRRDTSVDQRTVVAKTPHNKLDESTRQRIRAVANSPD